MNIHDIFSEFPEKIWLNISSKLSPNQMSRLIFSRKKNNNNKKKKKKKKKKNKTNTKNQRFLDIVCSYL